MTPIDHFSKFTAGETVIQVSLYKIDGMPFVQVKFDKIPNDREAQIFAMSILSGTLSATLADITGKSKEYNKLFRDVLNKAGRTMHFADEDLR
jgi:hypothetical protein